MCEPSTMAALFMASSGAQLLVQNQTADRQSRALENSSQAAADQDSASKTISIGERIKQGRIERARIAVAAGESGAQGASFEATLADSLFQQEEDVSLLKKQAEFDGAAIKANAASKAAQINRPTFLGSAAKLTASGVAGYNTGLQIKSLK